MRSGLAGFRPGVARIWFYFVERLTSANDLKFLRRGREFNLGTSNR
jgi:hypothetical protein